MPKPKSHKFSKKRDFKKNTFKKKKITTQVDLIGAERKNKDVVANYVMPIGGLFSNPVLLSGIAVGGDANTRVGRRITMKSINMRYILTCTAVPGGGPDGLEPNRARIVLIYDKSPNGALPTITDIWDPTSSFTSMLDLNNADRFVIIADEMSEQVQGKAAQTVVGQAMASGTCYRKINMEAVFSGTGGTIADVRTGAIYILVCGDATTTPTSGTYAVSALTRIRYTDV